jgi:hypothetical protein
MHLPSPAALFALLAVLPAQNLVPNGEFHDGNAGWTLVAFNDPLGTNGFAAARTAGNGPSMAVFANFQTLTSVMSATFQSPPVALPQGPLPVGFRAMWEKQVTTPIPYPTVNRVELRIVDAATNLVVYTGTQGSPNQAGLLERASFSAVANIPAAGNYSFVVFLRHSNLAGIPFTNWVDDVYCGALTTEVFGQGCAGSGGFVPVIGSSNTPRVNSNNFTIELNDAFGPSLGVFLVDQSNTVWAGGALPFALGGGCNLLVGGAVSLFRLITTNGPGTGSLGQVFPVPANPAFGGLTFYAQWGVLDPAAPNPYGAVSTAGFRFTIQ